MVTIVRRAGLLAWGALCLWAAWTFWREVLAGWGLARRRPGVGVDRATGNRYGVRLSPLTGAELAAARAAEDRAWADPEAFAEVPCGCG